ncbi:MAG: hypothetical protein JXA51_07385 [Dehalococcoidales bacterium]|nr:hypothetical protein [Dehalococcoidales bacterium]
MALEPALEEARRKLKRIIAEHKLGKEFVQVTIGTLSVEQAIGDPSRRDFPLLEGREVMIEAEFHGSHGQAFTDRPHDFTGSINDVLNLSLDTTENRAIFIATLNAVTAYLSIVTGTRHCHDEEPEECAGEIARYLLGETGKVKIGMIGLQPAILDNLVRTFGEENVRCTDLNPKNMGSRKYGAEIWDGRTETGRLIEWGDILLVTSSTLVNNTFDYIRKEAAARDKRLINFGVTGAGISALLDLERICFLPH